MDPGTLCFWLLLAPWAMGRKVPEISAAVGQFAELDCGADQEVGAQRTVSWQRQMEPGGGHQLVARFTTGPEARFGRRLGLVQDGELYFLLRNVSRSDLGTYTCHGPNGSAVSSELRLTDNCSSGFSVELHTVSSLPAVSLYGNATLPHRWCIGELFVSPCGTTGTALSRGEARRPGRKGQTHLLKKVSLQPGYSVLMERGATLVIASLSYHHEGTYTCRMGKTLYQVKLRVLGPGILSSVARIWIILVTVASSLGLYILLITLVLAFRRKQKRRTHTERLSHVMRGFFRHTSESDLHFSENKDSATELNGTTVREASCSTNYENLGSRENISAGKQRSLSDHLNTETDAAQSYENLGEDGEEEDDDYLDPASENESTNTEDYMEPDSETAVRQESDPHGESAPGLEGEWGTGASVYAVPNKATREEEPGLRVGLGRTEPHPGQIEENTQDGGTSEEDSELPEWNVEWRQRTAPRELEADRNLQDDDYMKMNAVHSASPRNIAPNVGLSSTEEAARMERCRKLFVQKFKSNMTRYGQDGDGDGDGDRDGDGERRRTLAASIEAAGSLRTPQRVKKSHGTRSMADRMATLPE